MAVVATSAPGAGWRRSLWNVLSNWAAFVIGVIVSLVLSPYIVHTLGDVTYGAWVLLGSMVGYLGLLDLGARGAVTRYIAAYHAAHRHEDAGQLASTALVMFAGMGCLAIAGAGGLALLVNHAFHVPDELTDAIRVALIVSGITMAISLVTGVFGGIVVGMQRFGALNAVNIALAVAQAIGVVAVLQAGGRLVALAIVHLSISVCRLGVSAWLSSRMYPELVLTPKAWRTSHLRTILSFGVSATAIQAAGAIINYTSALVIGAFLPVAAITVFAIAATMTDHVRSVIAGISQTVTPMVGALEGGRRSSDVGGVFLQGARFATLAVLPIIVTLEIRGASFISIWMGADYAAPVGAILVVLALAVWAFAGYQVVTATLIGMNRHGRLIPVFIAEALVNLFFSIVLVKPFGILGVAWATTVPRLIVSLLVGPLYVRHYIGVPLHTYYSQTLLRPTAGIVPFALVTYAMEAWWPASNLPAFFGQVIAALVVAAAGAWFIVLTSGERSAIATALAPGRAASAVR